MSAAIKDQDEENANKLLAALSVKEEAPDQKDFETEEEFFLAYKKYRSSNNSIKEESQEELIKSYLTKSQRMDFDDRVLWFTMNFTIQRKHNG